MIRAAAQRNTVVFTLNTAKIRPFVAALALGAGLVASSGCDEFGSPAGAAPSVVAKAEKAREGARATLTAAMKAAQDLTATCVAADLHWDADVSGTTIPHHFSRPCIPERCSPKPAEVEALRASVAAAKKLVDGDVDLQIPSFQGFVALSEATLSFVDTALAGKAAAAAGKENPLVLSGLSMHYTSMATALREIYKDAEAPLEPPSLTTSLAVAQPGGDVCKGWAVPTDCDVKAVRVPKVRKWRTDPACIEVESVMK